MHTRRAALAAATITAAATVLAGLPACHAFDAFLDKYDAPDPRTYTKQPGYACGTMYVACTDTNDAGVEVPTGACCPQSRSFCGGHGWRHTSCFAGECCPASYGARLGDGGEDAGDRVRVLQVPAAETSR